MVGLRVVSVRRERMLPAAPPLVTLPIVLIALLMFSEFAVHLFKARDGSSTWYFRFSPKAVLQVRDDGDWCWREGVRALAARDRTVPRPRRSAAGGGRR